MFASQFRPLIFWSFAFVTSTMADPMLNGIFGSGGSSSQEPGSIVPKVGRWYKITCPVHPQSHPNERNMELINVSSSNTIQYFTWSNPLKPSPDKQTAKRKKIVLANTRGESTIFVQQMPGLNYVEWHKMEAKVQQVETKEILTFKGALGMNLPDARPYRFRCNREIVFNTGLCLFEKMCNMRLIEPDENWYNNEYIYTSWPPSQ